MLSSPVSSREEPHADLAGGKPPTAVDDETPVNRAATTFATPDDFAELLRSPENVDASQERFLVVAPRAPSLANPTAIIGSAAADVDGDVAIVHLPRHNVAARLLESFEHSRGSTGSSLTSSPTSPDGRLQRTPRRRPTATVKERSLDSDPLEGRSVVSSVR